MKRTDSRSGKGKLGAIAAAIVAAVGVIAGGNAMSGDNGGAEVPQVQTVAVQTQQSAAPAEDENSAVTNVEEKDDVQAVQYHFRNKKTLTSHFEKHGGEFDGAYASADEYEAGASAVVNDPRALHKTEAEDGDDVYYIEETNEFVVVSTDGYLRTYFKPTRGRQYYESQ